jgi:class 3 adenylate cyclase/tetratricopeptide (TPR) repeat protein
MELLVYRDPEEARKLLDSVLERMMEAVHRYEGTVSQVMGDGILALFGAPLAHEDHAVRACYAAMRMQEAIAQYADELRRGSGVDVQIRVGLNSGEVVVGSIGSDLHVEYTAIGQTTHLAARMEQLARPGTTLMTDATLRQAEGYVQVKPLGPMPIKGMTEAVPVYELIGAGTARTRLQAAAGRGFTAFVGRDTEMQQLGGALEDAARSRGRLVAVVGEPGVGKSRLFYEFSHSHRSHGWLVLESSSVSYGKATPYLPVIDLLKGYFKIGDRDDIRTIRAKVTGNVLALDETLQESVGPLLWLLEATPEDHPFLLLSAPQRRDRTLEAVKRLLLRESQSQPLLLIFEDLHWIDAETQALLDTLVESLPGATLLIAVNYRPEFQHGWANKSYYRQIRIDPLPPESAEAMLELLMGDDRGLSSLKRLLIERTEGNPLFLEECVRTLVETQSLVGQPGSYRLGKAVGGAEVPATVQAILAARIDRLPANDKRLLQAASVIGKDVPWVLILEIGEMEDQDLRAGMGRLKTAEFLYEAKLFPDLEYTFKHSLTHEVAYGSLLHERRREIHARIVAAIERIYSDRLPEHFDRLAHHAFRGEVWDKALRYLREVGREVSAPASSSTLTAILGEPEGPGQLWWKGKHDQAIAIASRDLVTASSFRVFSLTVTANLRLGQAYHSLGDYSHAVAALERNLSLLEGDPSGESFGLAGLPSVLSRVWLAFCQAEQGLFDQAIAHADEAAAIAESADHMYSRAVAQLGVGAVRSLRGDSSEAIAPLERGLVIANLSGFSLLFPMIAAPLGLAYATLGRSDGLRLLEEAVESAEAMEFMANHALRLAWLGQAYLLAGQRAAAARIGLRACELATKQGERGNEAYALRLLADLAVSTDQPDPAEGAEQYGKALELAETLGMRPLAAHCQFSLARLEARTEDSTTSLPGPR